MKTFTFLIFILLIFLGLTPHNNEHHLSIDVKHDGNSIDTTDLSIRFLHAEPYLEATGLIGYWPMDEGSGYEFSDHSPNRNTAYIFGTQWNTKDSGLTSSFRRKGRRGGAVYLNGTQWLQAKNLPQYGMRNSTLSAWVRVEQIKQQTTFISLGEKKGYAVNVAADGSVCLVAFDAKGEEKSYCSGKNTLRVNKWIQITCSADLAKSQVRLYINGELVKAIESSPVSISKSLPDLVIGGVEGKGGIVGLIDEVAIFTKPFNDQEVRQLYYNGLPKTYYQTRETIDPSFSVWTNYKGNQHIPHQQDSSTLFLASFNGTVTSGKGLKPRNYSGKEKFQPGYFSGACDAGSTGNGLIYDSPVMSAQGTFQSWIVPAENLPVSSSNKRMLFKATGNRQDVQLFYLNDRWNISVSSKNKKTSLLRTGKINMQAMQLIHVAFSWERKGLGTEFILFINGVEKGRIIVPGNFLLNDKIQIGGAENERLNAGIDDVKISSDVKGWRTICPRGHIDTESAPLDLMDDFDHDSTTAVFHWKALVESENWNYGEKKWEKGKLYGDSDGRRRCLVQRDPSGVNVVFHPDAYGFMSSIEAGVSFRNNVNGWAGVIVKGSNAEKLISGNTFMINPDQNKIRLAAYDKGNIAIEKTLPYDFKLKPQTTYTLTLTCVDNVLRGYIDGHNIISLNYDKQPVNGYGGLITDNASAYFDDVHFTAITPSSERSRLINTLSFSDGPWMELTANPGKVSLNAFRWKKRYGSLPWHRNYKNPEPPGNIFGPATDIVSRPNAVEYWRSEDDANSDILTVDGTMYYFMRGNPDFNGPHGVASIGTLVSRADTFDGIHFSDQNKGINNLDKADLLRGHEDKSYCPENAPRDNRFQVNDEGAVYLDKKIIVMAREFKNPFSAFRRLVYGVYDVPSQKWQQTEPYTVTWSHMTPDSCYSKIIGLNATPEVCALRDPETDTHVIFLYHSRQTSEGISTSGVIGLTYDGKDLIINADYPAKDTYTKHDQDAVYGERIFFDNGIYYMHVNAGSDKTKLRKDWPDRFQLFMSLHPYNGPWNASAENENTERPYFTRGGEFDADNAAIWQGTMFKHRNFYYMYYENFHSIGDVNNPYDQYDEVHSGSRVGYAIAN